MQLVALIVILGATLANGAHLPNTAQGHCDNDIIIMLDSSGSIQDDGGAGNWDKVKSFAQLLVEKVNEVSTVGDRSRIGVISYSNRIVTVASLQENKTAVDLAAAIESEEHQGSITRMLAGIIEAQREFRIANRSRPYASKALILFTDGVPFDSGNSDETLPNVINVLTRDFLDKGIFVYVIGVHNVNETLLTAIADHSDSGFSNRATSLESLNTYPDEVISNLNIRCSVPTPIQCGLDAFVLIDSSGSIGSTVFEKVVKPFARIMINDINNRFDIDGGQTRVALETFSDRRTLHLPLEEGTDTDDIKDAITSMRFHDSWTHVVQYTREAKDELMKKRRDGVELRLIILTDGVPERANDRDRDESLGELVKLLNEMRTGAVPIYTSVIGFVGDKTDLALLQANLKTLAQEAQATVTNFAAFDGSISASAHAVSKMGVECNSVPTPIPICVVSLEPVNLAIVIDDTSRDRFDESRQIAQEILDSIRRPVNYFESGYIAVTLVTSSQTVEVSGNDLVMNIITNMGGNNDNKLLKALDRAHSVMQVPPNTIDTSYSGYSVVLVIHSGVFNEDSPTSDSDSFYHVVYTKLKHSAQANIHSLPLASANVQGLEVLKRLQTQPGELLTRGIPYVDVLRSTCPAGYPCQWIDVALMLDVSGSSDLEDTKNSALQALASFKEMSDVYTHVSIVSFSEYTNVYNDLENGAIYNDDVYNQLRTYVQNLQPSPQTMTNIAQALNYVAMMVFNNHGDRRSGTDHIIIISDGETNLVDGVLDETKALNMARDSGIDVIAFKPISIVRSEHNMMTFRTFFPEMTSGNFPQIIRRQLTDNRDCQLRDIIPVCSKDLYILFDSSGSVNDYGDAGYMAVKEFVYTVMDTYYTNGATGDVSVAYYSNANDGAVVVLALDDYSSTLDDIKANITVSAFLGGQTDLESALNSITTDISDSSKSTTSILVITDGQTNVGEDGDVVIKAVVDAGYNVFAVLVVPPTGYYDDERADIQDVLGDKSVIASSYDGIETNPDDGDVDNSDWAAKVVCS